MAHAPHFDVRFPVPVLNIVLAGVLAMFALSVVVGTTLADHDADGAGGGGGDSAPATDADPGDDTDGCTAEAGELVRRPFSDRSPWNQPLGDDVRYTDADDPRTAQLRVARVGEKNGDSSWPVRTWLNVERYSIPVAVAGPCDPTATVVEDDDGDTFRVPVPADAEPADGNDAHIVFVDPDQERAVELWHAERTDDERWTADRVEVVSLDGDGLGPDGGVRAYGGSALGGLIRTWEVDTAHPAHDGGDIEHALAIALPSAMLRYDDGPGGYDDEGYGTALGYEWPATEQDFDSPFAYHGEIPMGTRVAIPPDVDLDDLELTPEARQVARTLQRYGAYVVDRTAGDTVALYAEPDVPTEWRDAVRGPSDSAAQLERIRQELVVVDQPRQPGEPTS